MLQIKRLLYWVMFFEEQVIWVSRKLSITLVNNLCFILPLSILRVYCLLHTFFIYKLKLQKTLLCGLYGKKLCTADFVSAGKRNIYRSLEVSGFSGFIKYDTKKINNNNGVELEIALTLALCKCFWKVYKTHSVDSELFQYFVCIPSRRETEVRVQKIDHR